MGSRCGCCSSVELPCTALHRNAEETVVGHCEGGVNGNRQLHTHTQIPTFTAMNAAEEYLEEELSSLLAMSVCRSICLFVY